MASQSKDAIRRIDLLLGLREAYRSQVQQARASALLLRIIDELFNLPAITHPRVCESLKITPRSAHLNIDKLVKVGVLREATGHRRNRVYAATEIVDIILVSIVVKLTAPDPYDLTEVDLKEYSAKR